MLGDRGASSAGREGNPAREASCSAAAGRPPHLAGGAADGRASYDRPHAAVRSPRARPASGSAKARPRPRRARHPAPAEPRRAMGERKTARAPSARAAGGDAGGAAEARGLSALRRPPSSTTRHAATAIASAVIMPPTAHGAPKCSARAPAWSAPASATSANDSGKVRELANSASATPKLVPPATSVRPLRIRREGLLHEHDDAGAVHSDGLHETEDQTGQLGLRRTPEGAGSVADPGHPGVPRQCRPCAAGYGLWIVTFPPPSACWPDM